MGGSTHPRDSATKRKRDRTKEESSRPRGRPKGSTSNRLAIGDGSVEPVDLVENQNEDPVEESDSDHSDFESDLRRQFLKS